MNNKLLSFLGITRKSGNIIFGMDSVKKEILNDKIRLLLITQDISENSFGEISKTANEHNIKMLKIHVTKDEINNATGKYAAIMGISNENFSKKIISLVTENIEQNENIIREEFNI